MSFRIVRLNEHTRTHEHLPAINALRQELTKGAKEITFTQLCETARHSRLWVVLDEKNAIIGMTTLVTAHTLDRKEGHVEAVVITEPHRKKGLGKELMNAVIKDAKDLGVHELHLTSRPSREEANHLYVSVGFEKRKTNVYRLKI